MKNHPLRYPFLLVWVLFALTLASSNQEFVIDADNKNEDERRLAIGDFADFNRILQGAVLYVPDASFSSDGATLRLSRVRCRSLSIGDLNLWSRQTSMTSVELNLQATDLGMYCTANYQFSAWWLFGGGGSGTVDIQSYGNDAFLKGRANSPNFMSEPPQNIVVETCNPTVYINSVNFSNGGIFGSILNIFRGLLANFMESQARSILCDMLRSSMEDTKDILKLAKDTLDNYKPNGQVFDPLAMENALWLLALLGFDLEGKEFLNFKDPSTEFAGWFQSNINQVVNFLSADAKDPNTGATDMQANILLRTHLLENGALTFDTADFSDGYSNVVYDGQNRISKTTINFDSVRMFGLDTLTRFNPLDTIGNYTFQNQLAWDFFGFQVKGTIIMTQSTQSDSIIETPTGTRIVEEVEFFIGLDDLVAELSTISLFDKDHLKNITLGSLLEKDNILPCMLSTILYADITSLSVDVNDILTPSLTGFVSPGLDRIFSSSMNAGFTMYEKIMLNAAPRYFQEKLRPIFSENFVSKYLYNSTCPRSDWSAGSSSDLIDFRDLILSPSDALTAGATGQEPYGNLFSSFAVPYLQDNIFQGELFNDGYVRPFTKTQSGKEGSLVLDQTLYRYNGNEASSPLYDSLKFTVSDLRFDNLDTVVDPMQALYPVNQNTLTNTIAFNGSAASGNVFADKDLTVTVQIAVDIDGSSSNKPLQMLNTIDASLSLPSSALTFDILANLQESSVINFPVFDLTNYHCWLASLDKSAAKSLALLSMSLDIDTLKFGSKCVFCSSPGMQTISEILDQLENIGFNQLYKDKIVAILVGLIADYTYNFDLEALVDEAPKHCPHHPDYDELAEIADFALPGLPTLRNDSAETIIAVGMIAMKCSMIVAAKNQLLLDEQELSPPSNDTVQVEFTEGSRIVNWTSLSEDLGDWVGVAFDEFRFQIKDTVKDTSKASQLSAANAPVSGSQRLGMNLQVNQMLRDYLLDSDGAYLMNFTDMSFSAMDFEMSLVRARIIGLDSIIAIEPLVATAPQTLENSVQFESLSVTFEVNIRTSNGDVKPMTISYDLQDITANFDFGIALDLARLEAVQLGSIFDMSSILFCAISGIRELQFYKLDLQVGSIDNPIVSGYFSDENQQNVQSIFQSLFDTYRTDLIEAIPSLFDTSLKDILNALMPNILESSYRQCPPPKENYMSGIIDFRDLLLSASMSVLNGGSGTSPYGNLFRTGYNWMQEKILQVGATDRPLINDLLRDVTERYFDMTGSMSFDGNSVDNSGRIKIAGLDAMFGIVVSDLFIENIDSVGDPLDIFRPLSGEANTLNNTVSVGVDSKPLGITGKLLLSLNDNVDMQIRNEMSFSVSFENVVLVASVMLKIAEKNFAAFPLRDLSNIDCWLATILSRSDDRSARLRGIDLIDHSFSVGNFSLGIDCTSCSSPRFDELLLSLYDFSNATEAIESVEAKTDSLLDAGFIQVLLDHVVEDAEKKCPHRPEYDPTASQEELLLSNSLSLFEDVEPVEKPIFFTVINSTIAGGIFIFGLLCRRMVERRNKEWMQSLSREGHFHLQLQKNKETEMIEMLNETSTSLLKSECVPKRVRYGVPIALALNLGLYLGAHLGVLSVVDIDATLAGEEFTLYSFLEFTFLDSTKATFENGGAEMVILLWIFTGIWPYIKIFLSLAMWVVPPQRMSVTTRGRILLWIDAAAKLSVIDIFTVVVGVALLLVFIGGPDESYVSEDALYSLKAIVVPRVGFYCIIVAQRMSRVSSRFFLEYHEQAIQHAAKVHKEKGQQESGDGDDSAMLSTPDRRSALQAPAPASEEGDSDHGRMLPRANSAFKDELYDREASSIPSLEDSSSEAEEESAQKEKRWGVIGVYCGAFTIVIVFIIGAIFAPSISLDASSVAALAIESDKTYAEIVENYGVFLVVCGVLLEARFVFDDTANYLGFGLLLFAGVVSVGAVFIMKAYQFIKRKLKERQTPPESPMHGHKGCGIPYYINLTKFRHMEIYLISVAVGIWQLGSIASYSIYLYCEILHRTFAFMSFIGLVEDSSAECYTIQATLPENLSIILGSFAVLVLSFLLQAKGQYKKNIAESLRWVDDDDVPHLSLAWSQDKSKNSRYSHLSSTLTASMSYDTAETTPQTLPESPNASFESSSSAYYAPPGVPLDDSSSSEATSTSTPTPESGLFSLRRNLFRRSQ